MIICKLYCLKCMGCCKTRIHNLDFSIQYAGTNVCKLVVDRHDINSELNVLFDTLLVLDSPASFRCSRSALYVRVNMTLCMCISALDTWNTMIIKASLLTNLTGGRTQSYLSNCIVPTYFFLCMQYIFPCLCMLYRVFPDHTICLLWMSAIYAISSAIAFKI